ncbi:hypothetical protein GGR57DRAFT_516704 [Xylariaceae sp. FL1272]|nr:hypothetical protein GGR57DRAFT_516704 [Xylariaceae sp. FL1272]
MRLPTLTLLLGMQAMAIVITTSSSSLLMTSVSEDIDTPTSTTHVSETVVVVTSMPEDDPLATSTTTKLSSSSSVSSTRTSTSMSAKTTSTAEPATHTVNVGQGGFKFTPNSLTAKTGDHVEFVFWPTGHSVARAEHGSPCLPYESVVPGGHGFWSGEILPTSDLDPHPTYTILINDTHPVFFYCGAPGSCKDHKMVGVINPNSTWTVQSQAAFINEETVDIQPGQPIPGEATETPTPGEGESSPHSHSSAGLSSGAIAGIAIASAVILIGVAVLLYFCGRQGGFEKGYRRSTFHAKPDMGVTQDGTPCCPPSDVFSAGTTRVGSSIYVPPSPAAPYSPMGNGEHLRPFSPYRSGVGMQSPALSESPVLPRDHLSPCRHEVEKVEIPDSQAPAELPADLHSRHM